MTSPILDEVSRRFGFHPATARTGPLHDAVRTAAREFARQLLAITPAGREQALALTAAQEAMMWGNAAVACNPEWIAEGRTAFALNPHSGKTP